MNVLFVTLDQFRADAYGAAGHPLVQTPTLDRLAREGARLARHYSQAAPCSPGRAAIYTGTYQMNNRVVTNGTPLPAGFDNLARVGRRAGYDPTLFGYTDQGLDPRWAAGDDDPRLDSYDGVLPGLSVGLYLPESQAGWIQWLRARGHDVPYGWAEALRGEPDRPAEDSLASFLTDRFLEWLGRQDAGWFAHLSFLRPHPPYAAAGEWSTRYDPDAVSLPIAPVGADARHPLHQTAMGYHRSAAPTGEAEMRHVIAQYLGMVSEVDAALGRVVAAIEARGEWDDTLMVVTADHGDQLGDHGLIEKLGYFPQSYHVVGLWRDPRRAGRGVVVDRFTENVDLLPTLAGALGLDVPAQCDGRSLAPLLDGGDAPWRGHAHYEWDYRGGSLVRQPTRRDLDWALATNNLCASVGEDLAYVQFGDGSWLAFDLAADPTWRTPCTDEGRVLDAAREQLVWRQTHLRREYTDMLLRPGRPGRWPELGARALGQTA